ncbi:hypothetical protein JTB14_000395, partial [Gonioctena quinquepunctata]
IGRLEDSHYLGNPAINLADYTESLFGIEIQRNSFPGK